MNTISSFKELAAAMNREIEGKTLDFIREQVSQQGTRLNLMSRAITRYFNAEQASKKFGFIGVGCITFAEGRLAKFCQKIGLTA